MFLINNKILIPNQYGFRKNHSTDYALINLCDKIVNALSNKEHMIGIFLDLSKAFDTINPNQAGLFWLFCGRGGVESTPP